MVLFYYSPKQLSVFHYLQLLPSLSFLKPLQSSFSHTTPFIFFLPILLVLVAFDKANQRCLLEKLFHSASQAPVFYHIENDSFSAFADFSVFAPHFNH